MRVIIAGSRNFNNYDVVCKAIEQSNFDIKEVVSGHAQGVDLLGELWAKEHNIPIKLFPAKWDDLKVKGAIIKINAWKKKYNSRAGTDRNLLMASYADALIAIQFEPTPGTQNMIKVAKEKGIPVFVYTKPDEDYEYKF